MDEDLREKLATIVKRKCDSCGEMIFVELYFSREETRLRLWQEGLCPGCGNTAFAAMPEAILVLDERARRILAN